jgi:hypothetical protein
MENQTPQEAPNAQPSPASIEPQSESPDQAGGSAAAAESQPPKPTNEDDPKFAARFAALSKREAALRKHEQSLKELQTKIQSWEQEQKLLQENPLEFLTKRGFTFDQLTQMALNDGKKPAEVKIQELEQRLEREKREREEAEMRRQEEARAKTRAGYIENATNFIKSKSQDYEFLSAQDDPGELIFEIVQQHYLRTAEKDSDGNLLKPGRILSMEDAAKAAEEWLEKEFEKFTKLNKVKSKFQQATAPSAPQQTAPNPAPTLTNAHASQVPSPDKRRPLTLDESRREAAKLLKWV